ncbi:phosphodiester glycosidase family protein [Paraflavitalea pollutisoli]|uniref:phosphodiester glycosidase family protein n=1 Tax=Paraflavitalea pollutisoli TaxID=3034143 RepID=UPI0023EC9213|nr:phosphodiester glycosidase family protein [Paraflavitalea sp. H1-2-19X]
MKAVNILSLGTLALAVALLPACTKKDGPLKSSYQFEATPQTALSKKLVDQTGLIAQVSTDTAYKLVEGVQVTELRYVSNVGNSMKLFVFEIDLTNPAVTLEAATPYNKPAFAMQPMTKQAIYEDREGHKVWGGVNADFFNTANGTPRGIVYKEGLAIKTSFTDAGTTFFGILKDGTAVIGNEARYNEVKNNLAEAVGGRVTLIDDGLLPIQTDATVEPRTCIGVSKDGKQVYIMVIDGRNFYYSNGMNYASLQQCMKAMGAYDAINIDGGGSSTFFIRNTPGFSDERFVLRNWPSDNGGQERAVANGLVIISK